MAIVLERLNYCSGVFTLYKPYRRELVSKADVGVLVFTFVRDMK